MTPAEALRELEKVHPPGTYVGWFAVLRFAIEERELLLQEKVELAFKLNAAERECTDLRDKIDQMRDDLAHQTQVSTG